MNIVILAAGMGKRMKSELPKVLHPIGGKPLVGHVLTTARQLMLNASPALAADVLPATAASGSAAKPAGQIVGVYGHGGDIVPTRMAAADVVWVLQNPQKGTGHAVAQAIPHLDDSVPTMILYGDVPLIRADTLARLQAAAGADKLAILTVMVDDPTGYGRIVRRDGKVSAIIEHKDADAETRRISEINSGILVAPTPALKRWLSGLTNNNAQGEYYLTDIVTAAVGEGVQVVAAQPSFTWEADGVNDKLQLARLERIHQNNIAEALMRDHGVTLADPARLDVRGTLEVGREVFIDVNCVFEGEVKLGDGVKIGPNCVIRDSTIGARTEIFGFTHVVQARIGASGQIGPFARLRPGTELGEDNHIGNFVELKAARMGNHSKANHLSYVGDSLVGQRVNIGAGTITCNYDGANKHLTIIEDDVHIGSDTQLVAPVKVGRGSTTAAGTTVWKEVPPDSLVLNSKDQLHKTGWKRPVKVKK